MRITRVRIDNFRCLRHVDLELSPLTVIIGPNGSGKSSLLEAIGFFRHVPSGLSFNHVLAPYGGFVANQSWYVCESEPIRLGLTVGQESDVLDYDVELRGEPRLGCFVASETLASRERPDSPSGDGLRLARRGAFVETSWGTGGSVAHGSETAVHRFVGDSDSVRPDTAMFLTVLERTSRWTSSRFQPGERVRSPQRLQPTEMPLNDGTDLFAALYTMQTERPDSFRELLDDLRLAIPAVQAIDFPLAGAGHVSLRWTQSDLPKPLYANQLSDGTLRLLWLLTVLHAVPDDGLVLIDEPELSLHPQWLLLLISILRSMSARTSFVVATQSVEFARWCEPGELVIADLTEAGAALTRVGDRGDIEEWLKDFTLGELWTMGELGGRR